MEIRSVTAPAPAAYTEDVDEFWNSIAGDELEAAGDRFINGISHSVSSLETSNSKNMASGILTMDGSFPELPQEEDLEWITNVEAFPSLETSNIGQPADDNLVLATKDLSPTSVLDWFNVDGSLRTGGNPNLNLIPNYPKGIRSKKRSRKMGGFGELVPSHEYLWSRAKVRPSTSFMAGRKCLHCEVDKTPQWRAGPDGPKTLCNACGVRYKAGGLFPEYRPACSPSFSGVLHSNSHRKVLQMRAKKVKV